MFIYIITNSESKKVYIGKTTKPDLYAYLKTKFRQAARHKGGSHLFNAMRKYPKHAWDIQPLISCLETEWQLSLWEKALICALDSTNPEFGYNICRGGEGFTGPHSPETCAKMSEITKRAWTDPKKRAKRLESMKMASSSPEFSAKMSETSKKKWLDPAYRAKMTEFLEKAWAVPEYRASHSGSMPDSVRSKIGKASKERWGDPVFRAKMSEKAVEASRKRWSNPQFRSKRAEAMANPGVRSKIGESSRGRWSDPAFRARMSEAFKKREAAKRGRRMIPSIATLR